MFDARTGGYLMRIRASDGAAGNFFGASVSLCGNLALVGAPGALSARGQMVVFDVAAGAALAVNDRWIALGDPSAEVGKGGGTIYSAAPGRRIRELRAPDADDGDAFGSTLSLCGNKLLVDRVAILRFLMRVRNSLLVSMLAATFRLESAISPPFPVLRAGLCWFDCGTGLNPAAR